MLLGGCVLVDHLSAPQQHGLGRFVRVHQRHPGHHPWVRRRQDRLGGQRPQLDHLPPTSQRRHAVRARAVGLVGDTKLALRAEHQDSVRAWSTALPNHGPIVGRGEVGPDVAQAIFLERYLMLARPGTEDRWPPSPSTAPPPRTIGHSPTRGKRPARRCRRRDQPGRTKAFDSSTRCPSSTARRDSLLERGGRATQEIVGAASRRSCSRTVDAGLDRVVLCDVNPELGNGRGEARQDQADD